MNYDIVVGLEVHIQMNTATKAFCDDAISFGARPNSHVSAVSLAHPGTLPVANHLHIKKAIQLGLALGCTINRTHYFDRKHYFYPDLPKGYQITQDNQPICIGGSLDITINNEVKPVKIHHIHMEEDAGKSIHDLSENFSYVDLNRAGTPLLELVTEPDLSSPDEVYEFIAELQKLLKYLQVSDADMEKGSMRCDCNVSVKPSGSPILGERCEIKNLNSKRFARTAVAYEAGRQIKMIEQGITFGKQTLHFDPSSGKTSKLREKEGVADYRYFPDPDLPPLKVNDQILEKIRNELPALPREVKKRLQSEFNLAEDYCNQLSASPEIFEFFLILVRESQSVKRSANLIVNQILPNLNENQTIAEFTLPTSTCSEYIKLLDSGSLNISQAHQKLWPLMLQDSELNLLNTAKHLGLMIEQDAKDLDQLVHDVLKQSRNQVAQYKKGKKALIGYFIGAVMKKSSGGIDPKILRETLIRILESDTYE